MSGPGAGAEPADGIAARDMGISMLFISHDMAVVERVSHQVAVMYLGRIVEIGSRRQVFENPNIAYPPVDVGGAGRRSARLKKISEDLRFRPIRRRSSGGPCGAAFGLSRGGARPSCAGRSGHARISATAKACDARITHMPK